ncbi:hypothetical protein [Rhodanobacter sp. Soil772]|uniref:hypothetical protein n=1 Tax=Rhodanobacter sp. Soil772 TaxID=1736406 RepID=UPI0012F9990D|nr:hypothetical protein [Rhodanobacter sp. Soil772]
MREAESLAREILSVIAHLLFALHSLRVVVRQAVVAVVLAALSRGACGVGGFASGPPRDVHHDPGFDAADALLR